MKAETHRSLLNARLGLLAAAGRTQRLLAAQCDRVVEMARDGTLTPEEARDELDMAQKAAHTSEYSIVKRTYNALPPEGTGVMPR